MNEKLIRLLCLIGVDPIIMARHYKILHLDRERFISQGIGTIIILLITITSSSLFFYELNYPNLELLNWGNLGNMIFVIFSGVIFVLLTTFIIYMIQRFICIVSNHTRQTFEVPITAYLRQIFLILLALICGAMLALPIQVWLFRVDIDREFLFQSQQKIFNSISFSEESANSRLIPLYQDFYGLGQEPVDVPKRQMIESKISGPDNTRGIRVESSADGPIKPIRITENIDQPKPDVVKKNPDIVPLQFHLQ